MLVYVSGTEGVPTYLTRRTGTRADRPELKMRLRPLRSESQTSGFKVESKSAVASSCTREGSLSLLRIKAQRLAAEQGKGLPIALRMRRGPAAH
jgi:hypothetical protein